MSFTSILWWQQSWNRERNSVFENSQLKIRRGRRSELVVSCQIVITPFCGLPVIFCGFISHLIGRETINIAEIFCGVQGFTGKTVILTLWTLHCFMESKNNWLSRSLPSSAVIVIFTILFHVKIRELSLAYNKAFPFSIAVDVLDRSIFFQP